MMRKILGPPGTGKTTRLLKYVETFWRLGTPLEKIGYFAFTKKAATEAKNRMLDNSRCDYNDPNGPIFVSVGTGGHSHTHLKDKFEWSIVQNNNDYGFLNLKILNGERMIGEFITNNGEIFDAFTINKAP